MSCVTQDDHRFGLRDREIHVWSANLGVPASPSLHQWKILSGEERQRAARFLLERDRDCYVLARSILRTLLGRYLGATPGEIVFDYGLNSKPELASPFDRQMLRFNLSHSHGQFLVAIARGFPVGVDIEKIRPEMDIETIAKRFFSSDEVEQLNALDSSARCHGFFHAWTRKEAYLKARSEGIAHGLDRFTVSLDPERPARLVADDRDPEAVHHWGIRELRAATGFSAAVSAGALACRVRQFAWRDVSLFPPRADEAWDQPTLSA